MNVILNLWQQQLHEIVISTQAGRKLQLYIDQTQDGYCLRGEFFDVSDHAWYLVDFKANRTQDAEAFLSGCIENFNQAMQKKSDVINKVHNTCNTPIVSEDVQQRILAAHGICAQVVVN